MKLQEKPFTELGKRLFYELWVWIGLPQAVHRLDQLFITPDKPVSQKGKKYGQQRQVHAQAILYSFLPGFRDILTQVKSGKRQPAQINDQSRKAHLHLQRAIAEQEYA